MANTSGLTRYLDPATWTIPGQQSGGSGGGRGSYPNVDAIAQDLPGGEGLVVCMSRVENLTAEDLLPYPYYFQCAPTESFTVDGAYNWSDYDTLRLGQRSRPSGTQLRTISFSSLFLDYTVRWQSWRGAAWPEFGLPAAIPADARELRDSLFDIMDAGTPFELFVHQIEERDTPDYQGLVTLRSVRASEKGGEPDAIYVDVSFTEYERVRLKRDRREKLAEKDRSYRLHEKDTLRFIAEKMYGESGAWKRIAEANGIKGVEPGDAGDLASWAKKKSKKTLSIPARRI